MYDTLRFAVAFHSPIATSAPHIYISAFPLLPMESLLWKKAKHLFMNLLEVCQGRLTLWPTHPSVLVGHTHRVYSVAYSPDGRHFVSGSSDNTIRIWDAE